MSFQVPSVVTWLYSHKAKLAPPSSPYQPAKSFIYGAVAMATTNNGEKNTISYRNRSFLSDCVAILKQRGSLQFECFPNLSAGREKIQCRLGVLGLRLS